MAADEETPDAEYDEDDWDDDQDFDLEFDCHMGADGLCGKAGSEECDWECPYNEGGVGG